MIKEYILETFNNREIALITYLLIFIGWILITKKKVRSSVADLLRILFGKKIFPAILFLIIYISIISVALSYISLWDTSMIKDSIYWTFGVGFILLMNSNKALEEEHYFRKILRDNFRLALIIEFILGLYVFGLVVEYILAIIIILFALILGISDTDKKYSQVTNLLYIIFGIIGVFYFIFSLYHIYKDINEFASFETLRSFLYPIIMMPLFIPFAYLYALYMHYESLFARLKFSMRHDKKLRKYAKRKILQSVGFRLNLLKRFSPGSLFSNCKSKQDIKSELKQILNKKQYTPSD